MKSAEDSPPAVRRNANGSIVRMGLLKRRSCLSTEDFVGRWRDLYGPLAAQLPGLRRCHLNVVVDSEQRAIDFPRGQVAFDGVSELWFDDETAMRQAQSSSAFDALAAGEANLADDIHVITAVQNVVVPTLQGVRLLKRMSTLARRVDVAPEVFQHEWFKIHSLLVMRLPQVKGYTQNLVLGRRQGHGARASGDELSIDGIVELWFQDVQNLHSAFRSPSGRTLMAHASEFIGEISTFLVEVHEVA